MPADALQAAQHVGEVAAEHAPVGVQFVDDDVAEVLEEPRPSRVVRQHAGMEHVGIAEDDVGAGANRAPRVGRRVAVVGEDADVALRRRADDLREPLEFGELVLSERLGGEQVQRPGTGLAQDRAQDGPVVAERLARGGGRDDDDVAPGQRVAHGLGLVRVRLLDAPRGQGLDEPRIDIGGPGGVPRGLGRDVTHGGHDLVAADLDVRAGRRVGPGQRGGHPAVGREMPQRLLQRLVLVPGEAHYGAGHRPSMLRRRRGAIKRRRSGYRDGHREPGTGAGTGTGTGTGTPSGQRRTTVAESKS